ncbi:MAG: hypothetical protein ACXV1K_04685 [Kineosporiaceae bacterium]
MRIRRPVAAVVISLALVGTGSLAGCGAAAEPKTGTPADRAQLTTGNDPSSDSQGNLPELSNREPSSTTTKG